MSSENGNMGRNRSDGMDQTNVIFATPAAIIQRATTAELLALAKAQRAFDPTVFDEHAPFFFGAEISSNRLDAYFTRMAPTSLRNYAADAQAGVSFQDSHCTDRLGLGRSLTGIYEEGGEDAVSPSNGQPAPAGERLARTLADFYTIAGLADTDPFITRLRAGIARDVSVGFYGGEGFAFRCSICNRDMMRNWDCFHVPGMRYEVRDPAGNITGQETAFAWVENAHLAEVSAVYDGATPGAAVLKAQQEADGGRMRPEVARMLEQRYRGIGLRLPAAHKTGAGVFVPGREGRMTEPILTPAVTPGEPDGNGIASDGASQTLEELQARVAELTGQLATAQAERQQALDVLAQRESELRTAEQGLRDTVAVLATSNAPAGVPIADAVRSVVTRAQDLEAEASRLHALADDGRQYRVDLIASAMAEGVRAYGPGFAQETYRGILEAAPLATIKRMRDDWQAVGDKLFAGGRLTVDGPDANKPTTDAKPVTDAAYRGV
jgi:hypothetical protein